MCIGTHTSPVRKKQRIIVTAELNMNALGSMLAICRDTGFRIYAIYIRLSK